MQKKNTICDPPDIQGFQFFFRPRDYFCSLSVAGRLKSAGCPVTETAKTYVNRNDLMYVVFVVFDATQRKGNTLQT